MTLRNSEVCNLSDDGEEQFERIWRIGILNPRSVSLRSDNSRRLHVPLFDLGLRGKMCIVPRHELPELLIDESLAAFSLDRFWGTVVAKFYDLLEAIDMISVLLSGPWGCFDVPKAVVEFVDDSDDTRRVSEVQLWGQQLQTPNASSFGTRSSGLEYVPGLSSSCHESSEVDKLERLTLTPQTKKWFFSSSVTMQELGLDCPLSFEDFSKLQLPKRFAAEM